MSLNNIKAKQAQRGFTIVELLIVIVVIGILAAITLVSYNGITTRANVASAKATAATLQKKAELYQADGPTGKYPLVATDLTSATADKSYYVASGNPTFSYGPTLAGATTPVTATNGTNTVAVRKCAASGGPSTQATIDTTAEITGLEINYWDYNTGSTTGSVIKVGETVNCPTT